MSRNLLKAAQEDAGRKLVSRLVWRLLTPIAAVGMLNLILFFAGSSYLGGDAVNGKIDNGKYYLWGDYQGRKQFHEVSQGVFDYSRWHVYSNFVTFPLMMLTGLIAERLGRQLQ